MRSVFIITALELICLVNAAPFFHHGHQKSLSDMLPAVFDAANVNSNAFLIGLQRKVQETEFALKNVLKNVGGIFKPPVGQEFVTPDPGYHPHNGASHMPSFGEQYYPNTGGHSSYPGFGGPNIYPGSGQWGPTGQNNYPSNVGQSEFSGNRGQYPSAGGTFGHPHSSGQSGYPSTEGQSTIPSRSEQTYYPGGQNTHQHITGQRYPTFGDPSGFGSYQGIPTTHPGNNGQHNYPVSEQNRQPLIVVPYKQPTSTGHENYPLSSSHNHDSIPTGNNGHRPNADAYTHPLLLGQNKYPSNTGQNGYQINPEQPTGQNNHQQVDRNNYQLTTEQNRQQPTTEGYIHPLLSGQNKHPVIADQINQPIITEQNGYQRTTEAYTHPLLAGQNKHPLLNVEQNNHPLFTGQNNRPLNIGQISTSGAGTQEKSHPEDEIVFPENQKNLPYSNQNSAYNKHGQTSLPLLSSNTHSKSNSTPAEDIIFPDAIK